MKKFLYFCLGIITNTILLGAFGSIAFYTQIVLYIVTLYLLFSLKRKALTTYFLFGAITTAELLGTQRFGLLFLFGSVLIILQHLFEKYLKIASPIIQFFLCSLLSIIIFTLTIRIL